MLAHYYVTLFTSTPRYFDVVSTSYFDAENKVRTVTGCINTKLGIIGGARENWSGQYYIENYYPPQLRLDDKIIYDHIS